MLLNLLNNAVKFTRSGAVTLSIRQLGAVEDGARLRFAVEDTGVGIAESKRPLLFERFSQVDGSIQREHGGTGLGLAISKRLVELMGGAIGCDSEVGRGSVFWFEVALPRASGMTPTASSIQPQPSARRRLLVVEDVVVNQELARAILERAGYQVQVASGGAEAVTAVQKTSFDLVLMDVQMPVIDGLTATRLIRTLDHPAAAVPIVAMSANVLPHQVALCREAGMQAHVGKPFKREDLIAVIERWAVAPACDGAPDHDVGHLDRPTFDQLAGPIGSAGTQRLLAAFARELQARFGGDLAPDAKTLAAHAHAVVGAASMLGFDGFATICRQAEAPQKDGEFRRLAASLQAGGRQVLTTLETLATVA